MLRFEHLTYTYPHQQRPAVEDVNFTVHAGEIVLCTGASGCGKSTLIRLANGLCPHYYQGVLQGRVLVDASSTDGCSIAGLARTMGTLFQDPEQQFFALNVEDELAFALEWQGMDRGDMQCAVASVSRDFGLHGLGDLALQSLSEGQKQKVGLAALCAQQPRALILDEPSANLDPEATMSLAQKLLDLKRQGLAIFVVDHRLYWLEGIADRVVVMHEGRVAAQGDFTLLHDAALRQRCGLRSARVPDVRHTLPLCAPCKAPETDENRGESRGENRGESRGESEGAALVSVRGLSYAHKGAQALYEDASFSLGPGITALLGDNGTGKTTLARLLAGLTPLTSGTVAFGEHIWADKERLRRTGIVLQNADHQLHMQSVLEEVETCLALGCALKQTGAKSPLFSGSSAKVKTERRAEALRLLELFHMHNLAARHPQSLSGGQKQRLVIACALAKHPQVLVLDEPTSGLDGRNMEKLAEVLDYYANNGVCVLLITHDLELLHKVCARALHLPLHPSYCEEETRERKGLLPPKLLSTATCGGASQVARD